MCNRNDDEDDYDDDDDSGNSITEISRKILHSSFINLRIYWSFIKGPILNDLVSYLRRREF